MVHASSSSRQTLPLSPRRQGLPGPTSDALAIILLSLSIPLCVPLSPPLPLPSLLCCQTGRRSQYVCLCCPGRWQISHGASIARPNGQPWPGPSHCYLACCPHPSLHMHSRVALVSSCSATPTLPMLTLTYLISGLHHTPLA